MSALKGRIPRGLRDHRTRAARTYGAYVRAKLARLGSLPVDARMILREAGRVVVALDQLAASLDVAVARPNRHREARRIRREQRALRVQLLNYEARLEELAGSNGHGQPSIADLVARRRAGA